MRRGSSNQFSLRRCHESLPSADGNAMVNLHNGSGRSRRCSYRVVDPRGGATMLADFDLLLIAVFCTVAAARRLAHLFPRLPPQPGYLKRCQRLGTSSKR